MRILDLTPTDGHDVGAGFGVRREHAVITVPVHTGGAG